MPSYDYVCPENGQVVEVRHRMSENISTWGELCELAGLDLQGIAANSPVKRLANGGQVVDSRSLSNPSAPPCATGPCCGAQMCDFS